MHWIASGIRWGFEVSAKEHGSPWRLLHGPSCYPRVHTVYSKVCTYHLAGSWWVFLPATLTLGTTISVFCGYIWRCNLAHVKSGSVQYWEIRHNRANIKMSGWHGKLSRSFSQVSKQNGLKLQIAGVSFIGTSNCMVWLPDSILRNWGRIKCKMQTDRFLVSQDLPQLLMTLQWALETHWEGGRNVVGEN